MLVLSRRVDESVVIQVGDKVIRLMLTQVERGQVRLSFDIPAGVTVDREEVWERKLRESSKKGA